MPPWYYLQPLLLNSIPLSLLVPAAVATAFTDRVPGLEESDDSREQYAALCARFFATFWVVTVVFFELSAFKRRAYLLPLWPASPVLMSWWVINRVVPREGIVAYQGLMATCLLLAAGNFFFLPPYELHGCGQSLSIVEMLKWPVESLAGRPSPYGFQAKSFREAAAQVDGAVAYNEPLFVFQIEDAIEPLVFYLRRCAPQLPGSLSAAPAGYILTTVRTWTRQKGGAPQLHSILNAPYDHDGLVLLRSGKTATLLSR
jgi:hypothetical protein